MKYKVLGDVTCFHGMDRYGSDPVRIIAQSNWLVVAYMKARKHISRHMHGSAWVTKGDCSHIKLAPVCDRL